MSTPEVKQPLYRAQMDIESVYAARLELLEQAFSNFKGGGKKEFAAAIGVADTYLPRMLKPRADKDSKPVGELVALKMEAGLELDPGTVLFPLALRIDSGARGPVLKYSASPRQPSVSECIEGLALHLRDVPERVRSLALGLLGALVDRPGEAKEVAEDITQLLAVTKRHSA